MSLELLPCRCGERGTGTIYLEWRIPRRQYDPRAVDPWYSHGSWAISTCGSPACEAAAYAEVAATRPTAEIAVLTEEPRYLVLEDDEDGAA